MEPSDVLDKTLKRLAEQIREKQMELTRVHAELQALQQKANKLDEARVIIAEETSASQSYAIKKVMDKPTVSLRDEVLKCLRGIAVAGAGATGGEVVSMLKALGYPNAGSKSFYPAVYTTLTRLAEAGEIDAIPGPKGRRFRPKDSTAYLFDDRQQDQPGVYIGNQRIDGGMS